MNDPAKLNEEEREELVAFLDGELPDDAAHQVETKLNTDPKVRAEADALRRTWDLLDYLPKSEPSTNFTHRTMERLGPVPTTQKVPRQARRLRRLVLGLSWAASLMLALGAGYGGMNQFLKRGPTDRDLVRDLRVIENKRLYEVGEDMDFLRQLDDPDLFGEETLES